MAGLVTPVWADRAGQLLPVPHGAPAVLMVATPVTTLRDQARALVRAALRAFLATLAGCPAEALNLHAEPGEAPRVDHLSPDGQPIHLSISHEAGLSLAAVCVGGRVGVDLMRAADAAMPDRQAIAQDYLGPVAAASLAALRGGDGQAAFARAWTRHEAALKCLGLRLQEWTPELERALEQCRVSELALPAGYVGAVAVCD
jgi:4'-phosphopantetheinyl transferase